MLYYINLHLFYLLTYFSLKYTEELSIEIGAVRCIQVVYRYWSSYCTAAAPRLAACLGVLVAARPQGCVPLRRCGTLWRPIRTVGVVVVRNASCSCWSRSEPSAMLWLTTWMPRTWNDRTMTLPTSVKVRQSSNSSVSTGRVTLYQAYFTIWARHVTD